MKSFVGLLVRLFVGLFVTIQATPFREGLTRQVSLLVQPFPEGVYEQAE
jgi:hypothetical protein